MLGASPPSVGGYPEPSAGSHCTAHPDTDVMLAGRGSGRRRKGYTTSMQERTDEAEEEDR